MFIISCLTIDFYLGNSYPSPTCLSIPEKKEKKMSLLSKTGHYQFGGKGQNCMNV